MLQWDSLQGVAIAIVAGGSLKAEHNQVVRGLVLQLRFDAFQDMSRSLTMLHANAMDPGVRDYIVERISHVVAPLCMLQLGCSPLSSNIGSGIDVVQDVDVQGRII